MTPPLASKHIAVIILSIPAFAFAAESSPPVMPTTTIVKIQPDGTRSEKPAHISPDVTSPYEVPGPESSPKTWCLCALTIEEEIFLRQYER